MDTGPDMPSLRRALRLFVTQPALSITIVVTLAIGLGSVTAILAVAYALLYRALPFPQADRIVVVHAEVDGLAGRLALREYQELERDASVFAHVGAYYRSQYNLSGDGPPQALTATMPTATVFDVLGVTPVHGAIWPATMDFTRHYTVVLSHRLWQRQFGGRTDVVGQSIVMDGASYLVSGVLPDGVDFPMLTDVYRGATDYNAPHVRRYSVVARLAQGRTLADVQERLAALSARLASSWPDTNSGVRLRAVPLRDSYVGRARPVIMLLVVGVSLLLVMAIVNVTTLLLTRVLTQEGDTAVRLALGASPADLARQHTGEALLLTAIGGGLGALAAGPALAALVRMVAADLPPWMRIDLDVRILVASAAVAAAAAVAIAVLPIRQAARADLERVLRQQAGRTGVRGGQRARRWLVGIQAALASVLLVMAGHFAAGVQQLITRDPGFDPRGVLTLRTDPPYTRYGDIAATSDFYRRLTEALQALPGVTHVGTSSNLPFARLDVASPRAAPDGGTTGRGDDAPFVNLQLVDPGYFDAMRIPIVSGRRFERTDGSDAPLVAIIGERTARRLWPGQDPLGRRLQLVWNQDGAGSGGGSALWLDIVGVARSVRFGGWDDDTSLDVYTPHTQMFAGDTYVVLRGQLPPASLVRQLRPAFDRVDPDQSFFDVLPIDARVARTLWQHRVATMVLTFFATVALALALVGTFAVTAHAVTAQQREFGVRRALGSSATRIVWLVARQWLVPVAVGVIIGIGVGRGASHRIALSAGLTVDAPPWALLLPSVLLAAALLACLAPLRGVLRRASLTDVLRAT